jgi:hypothetical protein
VIDSETTRIRLGDIGVMHCPASSRRCYGCYPTLGAIASMSEDIGVRAPPAHLSPNSMGTLYHGSVTIS